MTESRVWLKQKGQNLPIAASPSLLVRKWILDQMKNDAPPPKKSKQAFWHDQKFEFLREC